MSLPRKNSVELRNETATAAKRRCSTSLTAAPDTVCNNDGADPETDLLHMLNPVRPLLQAAD